MAKFEEEKNTIGDKMIDEACKAYGIDKKFVSNSRYDEASKTAIVVTNGGKKVSYKAGDKVEPLGDIAITGINPAKRKVIAGAKKA
jgi:hypothetical protein